ncbi:hypothetical protein F5X98DRAFT_386242 [Xylaria grammica]|nr:hypothetical protein F5X98DRAFT_386242 [Xylaria grammica]
MAFQTKAFDLTDEEKHETLGEIRSYVLGTGALIARARRTDCPHLYSEALALINKAIMLATDPDACDPSLAPLATCYLYKGHILLALRYEEDAYDAYEKAANTETREFTDTATSQEQARRILEQRSARRRNGEQQEKGADDLRYVLPLPGKGTEGETVVVCSTDGIALPITLRPGVSRQHSKVVARTRRVPRPRRAVYENANANANATA